MSYKVTVIIPTYNSVDFLDETIDSIKNQTIGFENIELILVDDYSTDNTQEMIDEYCRKYENIKTYESGKKTGTPGRARNIAMKYAQADYIMFIDHDDKYSETCVENLYTAITENSADVAIGKFQNFGENNIVTEHWITENVILNSIDENLLFLSINGIWRMIFPKEFLKKHDITFPEGVFAEDLTFMIDVFVNSNKIVFINDIVYKFRLRTGENSSTSLSKGMHYLNGLIEGYKNTVEVLKKNNAMKYYDTVFNQHLTCWLSDVALSETISSDDKKMLIDKSVPFFKKMNDISPFPPNDTLKDIIHDISDENMEVAYEKVENYNIYTNQIHLLELEIENQRNRIANLQTTKGWFKYKTNNIKERLINKFNHWLIFQKDYPTAQHVNLSYNF